MHEIKINNTQIKIPSCWDELTRKQLELIAGMASMGFSEMEFKSYLLFYVAGIRVKKTDCFRDPESNSEKLYQVKLSDARAAYLTPAQLTSLANCFDFLFQKSETPELQQAVVLDPRLTKNLIPAFKVSGTTYYGPSDKLFNITFSEFIHAETNLKRFLKTRQFQYLDKLIAVLYRPQDNKYNPDSPDFKGDRRTPFNDHKIDARAEKFRKLNQTVKTSILYFYQGCQSWLMVQFPHVFSQKSSAEPDNLGFLGLVDALTAGDVTKTEQIRSGYLIDIMVHLERAAKEYKRVKKDLKKK